MHSIDSRNKPHHSGCCLKWIQHAQQRAPVLADLLTEDFWTRALAAVPQMKRKHRSKSSRSKHAQRGTERGYTQVARDAVRIAGMIEDLDDWQGENARESRRLQKRRGQVAAQIHVVNCRGRALADKEGQLAEQLAQASSRRPNRHLLSSLSSCLPRRRCPTAFRPACRITPISHPIRRTAWLPLLRDSTSRTRAPENSFPR